MDFSIKRFLPEVFGFVLVVISHRILGRRFASKKLVLASGIFSISTLLLNIPPLWRHLPPGLAYEWARGLGMLWAMAAVGTALLLELFSRLSPPVDAARRQVLQTASMAAPALLLGYGSLYERNQLVPKQVDISIPGLPKDLHGLRIAQISDIHMSGFFGERDLVPAIDMANNFQPHLTFVTGDLITRENDPLDECLRQLKRLRSAAGVFGCMGNHEIYGNCLEYVERESAKFGARFLRSTAESLRFGNARLRIAGVDYQRVSHPYLAGTESLLDKDAFNILLSHNPDVFPTAAGQGWDLTVAGHTHGGQVTVEYLNQHLNLARFITPYVYGTYQKESSHLYVTRGIGTVGVPARIGATPEVALIRLCAI